MMDLIPVMIDGAIVFNLQNTCQTRSSQCENCTHLILNMHNWIMHTELEYTIIDLQDEKDICPIFLEELLLLKKRLLGPFLFAGVMEKPLDYLERFYSSSFPIFITPEDAVRALRIQRPGITESPVKSPIKIGFPILLSWKQIQGETLNV